VIPPGDYKAQLIDVQVDGAVVTQRLALEDGATITVITRADANEEVVERFKARVADSIRDAAQALDIAASTMRTFESYFDEDDFDELGRITGQLYQIAARTRT